MMRLAFLRNVFHGYGVCVILNTKIYKITCEQKIYDRFPSLPRKNPLTKTMLQKFTLSTYFIDIYYS